MTLLHDLFLDLATSENPAVLPEIELAKLALMTSKDEEAIESDAPPRGTGTSTGSADTESTLVESVIGPQLPPGFNVNAESTSSPTTPPQTSRTSTLPLSPTASILGKRSGEAIESERRSPMDIDVTSPQEKSRLLDSSPKFAPKHQDGDVEMQEGDSPPPLIADPTGPQPPPLPPRRRTEVVADMMFGLF